MCSITESVLEPELVSRLSLNETVRCKKCQSEACAVVLRGKDAYCRSCLILGVQHKMRATLGKNKGRSGERTLCERITAPTCSHPTRGPGLSWSERRGEQHSSAAPVEGWDGERPQEAAVCPGCRLVG